jgi:hypothetical protein
MHAPIAVVFLTSALATSLTLAQTTATWGTYGAGCPGTGIGLGGMLIVPAAAATTWGSGNAIPFGWSPVKYQQVFLGSELTTAFTIAALWLRQPHTGTAALGFTVDLDIQLGYTTRWQTTLSTTFAANWDASAPVQVVPRARASAAAAAASGCRGARGPAAARAVRGAVGVVRQDALDLEQLAMVVREDALFEQGIRSEVVGVLVRRIVHGARRM